MIDTIRTAFTDKEEANSILLIDDNESILKPLKGFLVKLGFSNIQTCSDSRLAMDILRAQHFGVILLDIMMPYINGFALLDMIQAEFPNIPVIMVTAVADPETVVKCMQYGAFNYLQKPIELERLASILKNAFDFVASRNEIDRLRKGNAAGTLFKPEIFKNIVTRNCAVHGIFSYIESISTNRHPVLITGETGTGKELIARAIHDSSGRKGAFVPVNIGGLSESLVDDELFGHCKGAFTGAMNDRSGMIEQAAEGTLFLDEIGDLGLSLQVKLLRLIQEQKYRMIGNDEPRLMSARIVVATNHSIEDRVRRGLFRNDLYYRLFTHRIHLPPLRERKEDIPLLLDYFLEKSAQELGKKIPPVPHQLHTLLTNYDFPGNIRELQSIIFDAMSRHVSGTLSMAVFKEKFTHDHYADNLVSDSEIDHPHKAKILFNGSLPTLKEAQDLLIAEALKAAKGNQEIAAGILGISRRALNGRLSRKRKANI